MTELLKKIFQHDRKALAKAITLVESTLSKHKEANNLIKDLLTNSDNKSIRMLYLEHQVQENQLLLKHSDQN